MRLFDVTQLLNTTCTRVFFIALFRIEGIPGGNGAPVIVATCAHKVMHHADLCSGQWALLLCFCPPRESPERPNQLREILIELSKRIQHIVEASYERLTMLILTPNLYAAILHLQNVIQKEIGDRCVIEVRQLMICHFLHWKTRFV